MHAHPDQRVLEPRVSFTKLFSCRGYRRLVAPNSSIRTSCGLSVVSFCLLSNILALTCVPSPNGDMMAIGDERASLVVCRASCHADIFYTGWLPKSPRQRWAAAMQMWVHNVAIREKKRPPSLGPWSSNNVYSPPD